MNKGNCSNLLSTDWPRLSYLCPLCRRAQRHQPKLVVSISQCPNNLRTLDLDMVLSSLSQAQSTAASLSPTLDAPPSHPSFCWPCRVLFKETAKEGLVVLPWPVRYQQRCPSLGNCRSSRAVIYCLGLYACVHKKPSSITPSDLWDSRGAVMFPDQGCLNQNPVASQPHIKSNFHCVFFLTAGHARQHATLKVEGLDSPALVPPFVATICFPGCVRVQSIVICVSRRSWVQGRHVRSKCSLSLSVCLFGKC